MTTLNKTNKENKYSILIPTYEEKINLPIICELIVSTLQPLNINFEIVVVDDNSPDGTYEVAQQLQSIYGSDIMVLLKRKGKLGLGTAYIDGLKKASGNFIILMDADFSHHPKYLPKFIDLQKKNNYDIVTGSRYISGGGVSGWGYSRKLVSRGANYIATTLLNPQVSDLTGAYRLYKRNVFEKIISTMDAKGYVFQMEIMVSAKKLGYKIGEIPIIFVDRMFGESKLGATEIVQYLKGVLGLMQKF